jgi:hypothetical protein
MTHAVRQFLLDLHSSWPEDDPGALARFYHPDAVLLPPDLGTPIVGREAIVLSYQDFLQTATLHDFKVTELDVHSFVTEGATSTHVAHLYFDILYSLSDVRFSEQGFEAYTIIETGDALQIIWRNQIVLDSEPGSAPPEHP